MYHLRRARPLGDRSRGAAAVEAALVLPVILVIFFAIFEFGLLFKDWLGVVSAVRAGARIASAEPRVSTFAQDAALQVQNGSTGIDMSGLQAMWVYQADSNGNPVGGSSSFTSCTTCVKFTWDNVNKKFILPAAYTGWTALQQNACPGDPAHDTIGIYMELKHQWITNAIFTSPIVLKEHTVMSLEPMPTTSGCK
ncbi:TadE family protein [Lapillicoccus sp.]|uniref:TadE/TadG family type IV pilus assembly protein n=1 Tax=Lapillicoccus sp. TaxID=1909287 RepID=UPI0025E2C282|nr:TadE family protein [Lapillicoccus sp.]